MECADQPPREESMPNRLVSLLPLALALACGAQSATPLAVTEYTLQQATDSIPLPYRTDIRVGEIWMTLTDVPSDSRCPIGVTCVWAGDAVADLSVHPGCYKAGCKAASERALAIARFVMAARIPRGTYSPPTE